MEDHGGKNEWNVNESWNISKHLTKSYTINYGR